MARKKIKKQELGVSDLPNQPQFPSSLKYNYHLVSKTEVVYPLITQPSMAFTPRQIIEQFASGEIIAQENSPTDEYYDDKFTEEQLFALHMIEDDFQLRQHVLDYYESQQNEKENVSSGATPPQGTEGTSGQVNTSVQPAESREQE